MNLDYQTLSMLAGAVAFGWAACKWFASKAPTGATIALRVAITAMEQRAKYSQELTASQKAKAAAVAAHDAELLKSLQDMVSKAE